MKAVTFTGTVLDGHKGAAVEVPFDPAIQWGKPAQRVGLNRRGHAVAGTVAGVPIESAVVPRSRRFWLSLDEPFLKRARIAVGQSITVSLSPM